jgi:hypothetical protein
MRIIIAVFFIFFSLRNNAGANGGLNDEPMKDRSILTAVQKISVPAENTTFRHVKVSGTNGDYIVTGESRTAAGSFFFTVEDGHVEYIKQTEVKTKGPSGEWQPF